MIKFQIFRDVRHILFPKHIYSHSDYFEAYRNEVIKRIVRINIFERLIKGKCAERLTKAEEMQCNSFLSAELQFKGTHF